jgi:hypothetical protein
VPWIFKRRIRIMPGLTLNLGKRNVSMSVGHRGMHYTTGTSGSRFTVGIPGTGLYNTTRLTSAHHASTNRRSPPIALDRVHLAGTGFWAFMTPGPSIEQLIASIRMRRADILALDNVADRVARLEQLDAAFVGLWGSAHADIGAALLAKPLSKTAIDAVIESYRSLFRDLIASVKHISEQEHDAHLGEHGTRPLEEAIDAFVQTLHAADDLMKRLLDPGHDAQVLDRDIRYTIESVQTRHAAFAQALRVADPNYTPVGSTLTFDF